MGAARAGLSELRVGERVEAHTFWVAFDPDKQSGPRCIEVLFFVAPGNGEHVWQCLDPTCGVTVAFWGREARMKGLIERGGGREGHQATLVACLPTGAAGPRARKEVRTFRTVRR